MQTAHYKPLSSKHGGLTLVELLVSLVVCSIILAAVATLAFAMGRANAATGDQNLKQAQVRCATLRISELIRHCRLIAAAGSEDVRIWRSDENADGNINVNELVFLQAGPDGAYLRLCEFPAGDDSTVTLADVAGLDPANYDVRYVTIMTQCSNVQFLVDAPPPNTRFVAVVFDLEENGTSRRYQVAASIRTWAGHLLDDSGSLAQDDDE